MAEKMTVEDVIINRLTRDGMKSETYRKFINDTTIPKDIASKIMIQLEKTGTTAAQDAVSLEQRWDNLQDLALEWLDNVMIFYNNPTGADVGVYFLEEKNIYVFPPLTP